MARRALRRLPLVTPRIRAAKAKFVDSETQSWKQNGTVSRTQELNGVSSNETTSFKPWGSTDVSQVGNFFQTTMRTASIGGFCGWLRGRVGPYPFAARRQLPDDAPREATRKKYREGRRRCIGLLRGLHDGRSDRDSPTGRRVGDPRSWSELSIARCGGLRGKRVDRVDGTLPGQSLQANQDRYDDTGHVYATQKTTFDGDFSNAGGARRMSRIRTGRCPGRWGGTIQHDDLACRDGRRRGSEYPKRPAKTGPSRSA